MAASRIFGSMIGNWLGKKITNDINEIKSEQRVNQAILETRTYEEYLNTKDLFYSNIKEMEYDDVMEFKYLVDELTGEKGREFDTKSSQINSLKGRLKSVKKLDYKDHEVIQEWLNERY